MVERLLPLERTIAERTSPSAFTSEQARYVRRKALNVFMTGLITSLTLISVAILGLILLLIVINGVGAINIDFFIREAPDGGIAHAILGSIQMLFVAGVIAIPLGIATSIFLSEIGRGWLAELVRSILDLLAQMPSIVVGLFVWALLIHNGITQRSGIAGSVALAIIMLPIVARSVEEILRLVPDTLREAALALGTPYWRVTLRVVIPTVLPGILTGVILAMARAAGETAPLLLTALGSQYFEFNMSQPMAAIPVQLYNDAVYTTSEALHQRAWAAGLVLIVVIALFSAIVRYITGKLRHATES